MSCLNRLVEFAKQANRPVTNVDLQGTCPYLSKNTINQALANSKAREMGLYRIRHGVYEYRNSAVSTNTKTTNMTTSKSNKGRIVQSAILQIEECLEEKNIEEAQQLIKSIKPLIGLHDYEALQ